ncbi:SURF1 family cytochrome oxidase biogenesis protein [Streptomyces buecherae]|uniref:SURF1 family cytochrome oxidase biogenesis protein n=1 Tax=Streptomyces buecherae TaxID=2763006 RepID=UPI001C2739DB|nr:SURF1 family cytochrome oxidase biogenesis protein [Streptomyces buecherae]
MYRFLLTRQWVILTLVGLVLIPVMIELGFWQLGRHEQRVEHNERVSKSLDAPAVPIGELTGVGRDVPKQTAMRKVTVSGTYDPRHEVVVRQRTGSDDQSIGYFVVTPLLLADGNAVLVNRGWIPAPGNLTQFPDVPAPPTGEVTITGRLKADETTGSSGIKDKKGLPPRQVMLINSERQAETVGRPLLGGYVELTDSKPRGAHQPEPVPAPDTSGIGSHMAYAVQWWLFTAAVPVGWVVLFRRELRDQAAAAAKAAEDAEAAREKAAAEPEAPGASDAAPAAADADTASRPEAQADATEPEAETAEPGAEAAGSDAGPDAKADAEPGAEPGEPGEPVAPAERTASVARSASASD